MIVERTGYFIERHFIDRTFQWNINDDIHLIMFLSTMDFNNESQA